MGTDQSKAQAIIGRFLSRVGKGRDELTPDVGLYGDGLELDSLEAAELSAMLEDELGSDPFSAGDQMPETIGDILGHRSAESTSVYLRLATGDLREVSLPVPALGSTKSKGATR